MASASMLTSRSQFWPSNFLRKGVMLFDLAQTSKVSTRKSERLYATHDLRKTEPAVWKRSFRITKARCGRLRADPPACRRPRCVALSASERGDYPLAL